MYFAYYCTVHTVEAWVLLLHGTEDGLCHAADGALTDVLIRQKTIVLQDMRLITTSTYSRTVIELSAGQVSYGIMLREANILTTSI